MSKIHEGKSSIVPRVFVPLYGSEQPDPARQMSRGQAWPTKDAGKPTAANIEKFIVQYYKSTKPGGANAHLGHLSKGWPVQPPARAYVYDQNKGEIVGEWKAPAFWVIDESTISIPQQIINSVEAATYYLRQSMSLEEGRKKAATFKRADCTVNTWFERDRAHVALECGDETVAEWWDDEVQDMADSGYFTMNKGDAALSRSVLDYAVEMGLISESVNEAKPVSEASIRDVRALIAKNNAETGTKFSLGGAYGNHELWAEDAKGGNHRLEAGSATDVYNAFVRERFKEKWRGNKTAPAGVSENRPMPFYKLDTDEVLSAYVEAALWSSTDDDGTPLDSNYDRSDIAPSTIASMKRDVEKFVSVLKRAKDLDLDGWSSAQIGHDLWLSRNGHGAGFFDRDLPSKDRLQKFAQAMREVDLYVDDDGKVRAMRESVDESAAVRSAIRVGGLQGVTAGLQNDGNVILFRSRDYDNKGTVSGPVVKIGKGDATFAAIAYDWNPGFDSDHGMSKDAHAEIRANAAKLAKRLPKNEAVSEGRDWDYERDGPGLLITAPDGRTCFLQGDEASELEDRLDATKTQRQINDILDAYDDVCEASKDESYTVHSKKPRKFDTLEAARKYADDYFKSTGIIVAVTPTKQKNESCDVDAILEAKRKAKGIYRTGENGVFFIANKDIDKSLVAKTDAKMEKKYGKGFSKLSDADKLKRIRGGMDKASKSGDTAKHRDHLKDYDAVASTKGGKKAQAAHRDRLDKKRYGKRAKWNESVDEGLGTFKNGRSQPITPMKGSWADEQKSGGADELTLVYDRHGEYLVKITGGWAKGKSLDTVRLGKGGDAAWDKLVREFGLGDRGIFVRDDGGSETVAGYPTGTGSFVKVAKSLGIKVKVQEATTMNSIASKAIAEARRKAGLPDKDVSEISTGARTAGFLMSDAPQSEKDKIAPGGNSFVAPPGVSAVGERIDQFLDSVSEAEKLTKAELILMDRKRAKRERRGKGHATGKQRLASKRNAKKAQRALLRGSTQRKAAKTRMRRGKLRGD